MTKHELDPRPPQEGDESPWGRIDRTQVIGEGVVYVSTPSHGGYWISRQKLSGLPSALQEGFGPHPWGPQWWEHDCAAAWLVLFLDAFRDHWAERAWTPERVARTLASAVDIVERHWPEQWSSVLAEADKDVRASFLEALELTRATVADLDAGRTDRKDVGR